MLFIILYKDHKTIGFRDIVERPPTAAKESNKSADRSRLNYRLRADRPAAN
jgi:hypothetical protein